MGRVIATTTSVNLAEVLAFMRPRHRMLVANTRSDSCPQISPAAGGDAEMLHLTALSLAAHPVEAGARSTVRPLPGPAPRARSGTRLGALSPASAKLNG
ncbi:MULTISPECIES: hypothetical protein [Cryobacterium]|uniref:Uncharacterized protein n=1 Tax=Cryobacterium breve TaxID=1259258 RepID=A0ABY2IW01_9MICO|nr:MULTISPECIES: hypothetical protein [Cryobacterium]TFC94656.1 hypothetical protein E3T20_07605 [Cryobacterium sp. TmT3-12]TFC95394.1 hypothetical protein E3O65_15245 [Cryobacterium breve]